ncbi:MAG: Crp/Fnr family transcriptional regulator [Bacteroidia bacterium]|nr:Crp/Fnr family transcriptional regulator [Bacteroidia bacterium]
MFIENDILVTWGGVAKKYKKGEYIFQEGEPAQFFYQIVSGRVRMFNVGSQGKEFTHLEFMSGESFGEPALLIDMPYPASVVAVEDTVIIKLKKESFCDLLNNYPALEKKLTYILAKRIYNKTVTAREMINTSPEVRILAVLNGYKKRKFEIDNMIEIPYTRQEIANFTGLRVETVIRTLNKMNLNGVVKISNRKLFY